MAETPPRFVTKSQGDEIGEAIYATMRDLETRGIDRSATAAAMVGIGAGVVGARLGKETAFELLASSRIEVERDGASSN